MGFLAAVVVVLAATGVWNPFPVVWGWLDGSAPLARSGLAWQQRLGGTPRSVTVAGEAVVVEHRTSVEGREPGTGARLWRRDADWAAVAGAGGTAVVLAGELLRHGYQVLDPRSGAVLRADGEAVAVWTFRTAVLDVRCAGPQDCTLSAWEPRGRDPLWRAQLPGVGFVLFADNPDLPGPRPPSGDRVAPAAAGPPALPPLVGFPVRERTHVVDTTSGRVLQELEAPRQERVLVTAGRILRVRADARDGTCYFSVQGSDAASGGEVWRRAGLNLRTVSGGGCAQRADPAGQDGVLVGVGPDGRELLLDGYDGRVLWSGGAGARVVALTGQHALVRTGDLLTCHQHGADRPRWSRPVHAQAQAALAGPVAVVVDRRPDRVLALDARTGAVLLQLETAARVVAVGPAGLLLADRRELGYAPFNGPAGGS